MTDNIPYEIGPLTTELVAICTEATFLLESGCNPGLSGFERQLRHRMRRWVNLEHLQHLHVMKSSLTGAGE